MQRFLTRLRGSKSSKSRTNRLRRNRFSQVEKLDARNMLTATVMTDLPDYAPAETAQVYASGFQAGETVEFQVLHNDGTPNTGNGHEPWQVTDGGAGDLDGLVDGNVHTTWFVDPDDSLDSSFDLTAQGLASGLAAATTFTDSAGDFSLDFVAAGADTYDHSTGGGAFDDRTIGKDKDVTESLAGEDFHSGDIVTYFVMIDVGDLQDGKPADQHLAETIEIELTFGTRATNGKEIGHIQIVGTSINYGPIARADLDGNMTLDVVGDGTGETDSGINDDWQPGTLASAASPLGSTATLVSQLYNDGTVPSGTYPDANTNATDLIARIRIDDLESHETVVLRVDVLIGNGDNASGSANVQAKLTDKNVVAAVDLAGTPIAYSGSISGGGQTISFNNIQAIVPSSPGFTVTKTADVASVAAAGDVINYTITVQNTGDVALTNPTISDPLLPMLSGPMGDGGTIGTLDAGETWTYTGSYLVQQSDIDNNGGGDGDIDNTVRVDFDQVEPVEASTEVSVIQNPSIRIAKVGELNVGADGIANPGDIIEYRFIVKNFGNVTLDNVSVVDLFPGIVVGAISDNAGDGAAVLAPGATETATATLVVTQLMIDSGSVYNTAQVRGSTPAGEEILDDDVTIVRIAQVPGIHIEKATNGEDADTPTGPLLETGSTATYTYVVTNTGNVTLRNVIVTDDQGVIPMFQGGDTDNNQLLDPSETWTYSASSTVVAGQYSNLGTVRASFESMDVSDSDPSHHFGISGDFSVTKQADVSSVAAAGDVINYTITVMNTGNVTLTNPTVSDPLLPMLSGPMGDGGTIGALDVGETWTYTGSYLVQQSDIDNNGGGDGDIDNTVTVDFDESDPIEASETVDIVRSVGFSVMKEADVSSVAAAGDVINYTITVMNTGNVTLINPTISDPLLPMLSGPMGDGGTIGALDAGETWTYTGSYLVQQSDIDNNGGGDGDIDNTVTVGFDESDPIEASETVDIDVVRESRIDIEKSTNGIDADTGTGPLIAVGGTATFTYRVTNVGETALNDVAVFDDQLGAITNLISNGNGDNILDVGEHWIYEATAIVTAGQYVNEGSVTAVDSQDEEVSDAELSHYFGVESRIDIEKSTNGVDADTGTGPLIAAGDTATFTYRVTNVGNVALTAVSVFDDQLGAITNLISDGNGDNILDVGEHWIYTATALVTAGQYVNEGSVTAVDPLDEVVSDSELSHHFGVDSRIDIEKFTNGVDADSPTGPLIAVGDSATFLYVVTNTGNVPLANVVVTDDNGTSIDTNDDFSPIYQSGDANNDGMLDINETWHYIAQRIVTSGPYANFGHVEAIDPLQKDVSDDDASHHLGVTSRIDIEKSTNGIDADTGTGPLIAAGDTATFTYRVTNVGETALTDVSVFDDQLGAITNLISDGNGDNILDVGEHWIYTATAIVTAGQYVNEGSVTAVDPHDHVVSDSELSHHFGVDSRIDIEKSTNGIDADTGTGPLIKAGDTATFTYRVTNVGNAALTDVSVFDDKLGAISNLISDGNGDDILDIGEHWVFEATAIVTAGQYVNEGSVTAIDPLDEVVSDSELSHHFGVVSGIDIEKHVNGQDADFPKGPVVEEGRPIDFTFYVTNTGNVPLFDVNVVDDNGTPMDTSDDFSPTFVGGDTNNDGLLDVNETWIYSAELIARLGQQVNTATVTAIDPLECEVEDSDRAHYFGERPLVVVGPDKGNDSVPIVKVIDKRDGSIISEFLAYEADFRGGVRVATADMDGDGVDEIITAPGRGRDAEIRVFKQDGTELVQFRTLAHGSSYQGGVDVAVGDINGDGRNDIVTSTTEGKAKIQVFYNSFPNADPISNTPDLKFKTYSKSFRGGANVAVADMGTFSNGNIIDANTPDGRAEIIVANGPGMASKVLVYDMSNGPAKVDAIKPTGSSFRGGVTVETGRINGDLIPDLIISSGNGGKSKVFVYDGLADGNADARLAKFKAFGDTASKNAPVHAVGVDTDFDGVIDLIAAVQGTDGGSGEIRCFTTDGNLVKKFSGFDGPWNIAPIHPMINGDFEREFEEGEYEMNADEFFEEMGDLA